MTGPSIQAAAEDPASFDEQIAFARSVAEVARLETEVETLREELASEVQNRKLRYPIAIGALVVMVLQIAASNAIFGWYGVANTWEISASAISAWMGTTVVEVVEVVVAVLVVMNYLIPRVR